MWRSDLREKVITPVFAAVVTRKVWRKSLVEEIKDEGGSASGYILNAVEEGTIEERAMEIERDIGPIEVVVYNLGAQIGDRNLQATSYRAFEMGWRLATFGLFRAASVVTAKMEERGRGIDWLPQRPLRCVATKASILTRRPWAVDVCSVRALTRSSDPKDSCSAHHY